jgi:MFS family permease
LLWSGQTVSSIGGGVSLIAFPLLALLITRSPAQAGFLGALRTLCYDAALVLPAGALVDRWNRKLVMIICDSGRALGLINGSAVDRNGRNPATCSGRTPDVINRWPAD